jgi:hypothetical protein
MAKIQWNTVENRRTIWKNPHCTTVFYGSIDFWESAIDNGVPYAKTDKELKNPLKIGVEKAVCEIFIEILYVTL